MKTISFKAIGVGIVAALAISFLFAILGTYWVLTVLDEQAPGVNFSNEIEIKVFIGHAVLHPLFILFAVIGTLVGVGIPAYLAAFVARRNFVLHSMLIGGFISLLCLTDWEVVMEFPLFVILVIVSTLVTAFAAGHLRKNQALGNVQ